MPKRKADDALPNKQVPKKKAISQLPPEDLDISPEEAFRRKHAVTFDIQPVSAVRVKSEAQDNDALQIPTTTPEINPTSSSDNDIGSSMVETSDTLAKRNTEADHPVSKNIAEDTLLTILSTHRDAEWAQIAIKGVLQHASESASRDDEFGTLYVRNFISQLAERVFEDAWLMEVIEMLQEKLEGRCDRVRSQILALGKARSPRTSRSNVVYTAQREGGESLMEQTVSEPFQPVSKPL